MISTETISGRSPQGSRSMTLTEGERHVFRRREKLAVSAWAARSIIVQDGPYRGARLRLEVTPYLAGIMDAWGWRQVEEVCVCGAPQTGKTLALHACLAYAVDRRPGTKMLAMPDDKALGRVETDKLRPLFLGSPALRRLTGKMTSGHIRYKDGSSLYLSSAQSPAQRASITVQDLFLDEEDLYQAVAGRGDPVQDFLERTRSYRLTRKIMRISKPVGDAKSSIWRAVTQDMDACLAYQVPCPSCFAKQIMHPEGLRIIDPRSGRASETGPAASSNSAVAPATPAEIIRDRLGRYQCEACGALWTDSLRDLAVAKGRWVPVRLTDQGFAPIAEDSEGLVAQARRIGYHLPAILSWAVSLSELASRMRKAELSDDPQIKQAHANGNWALPYTAVTVEPDENVILSRVDPDLPARSVPHGALVLTCGVDVQKRGFYYLVLAWMPDMTTYIIDYGRLAQFDDVTRLIWETAWPVLGHDSNPSGQLMEIWRAGMDTGGTEGEGVYTRTEECYEYIRAYGFDRLHAVKGASRDQAQAVRWSVLDKLPHRQTPIPGGLMLYLLDTSKLKGALFVSLMDPEAARPVKLYGVDPARADGPGPIAGGSTGQTDYQPAAELHAELVAHLTSERQVRTPSGKLVWEQIRRANHWLDCLMIARAAGDVSWTPSLHHIIMQLKAEAETPPPPPPTRRGESKPREERSRIW